MVTFNDKLQNNNQNIKKEIKVNLKIFIIDKRDLLQKHKRYDFPESKNIIKIGRESETLDICLKNEEVSNIHCTIKFDKTKTTWIIKDGSENKLSSNGTWILIQEYFEIPKNGNTYFRYEDKVFMTYYEYDI